MIDHDAHDCRREGCGSLSYGPALRVKESRPMRIATLPLHAGGERIMSAPVPTESLTRDEAIAAFAALLESAQRERYVRDYPNVTPPKVTVKPGSKYTKVDIGGSGKYMVVNATGEIFGIKAYGVIHRGHHFGTLATIHEWDWSDYTGKRRAQ